MESSEHSSLEPSAETPASDFDTEFPAALTEAETTLNQIRARYQEIKTAQVEKAQLESKLATLQTDLAAKAQLEESVAALEAELEQVQEQIQSLGITLESQLWKWHDLKEPFWQFIRHFGLGFAAAYALHKLSS